MTPAPRPLERERPADFGAGVRRLILARPLVTIVLAGLIVRITLMPLWAHLPNGLTDEGFWKHWIEHIHSGGVLNIFRTTNTDYVGYHWVLWLLTLVYEVMGGPYNSSTLRSTSW